jgi:hypothetical protein
MTIWKAYEKRKEEDRKAKQLARQEARKARAKAILGI